MVEEWDTCVSTCVRVAGGCKAPHLLWKVLTLALQKWGGE